MKVKVMPVYLVFLTILTTQSFAQEPITVLLARTAGVSDTDAREMLDQINDLVDKSDIESLGGFVSASMIGGFPEVFIVNCPSTNGPAIVSCARTSLSSTRNSKAADIVLLMVSQDIFNDCGAVDPVMINTLVVSTINHELGYAAVEKGCFLEQFNGHVVASHEVGHLLYIEHIDGDLYESLPALAPANHAMNDIVNNATAVASAGDCIFPSCSWHNFLSDKDKDFPGLFGGSAGNSDDSHAVGVVESISWSTVAAYRPIPQAQAAQVWQLPCWCIYKSGYQDSSWASTQSEPGLSFLVEKQSGGGAWTEVYEGDPECLILPAPFGGVLHRVKVLIEGMLPSIYVYFTSQCDCLNGGGGGGPE